MGRRLHVGVSVSAGRSEGRGGVRRPVQARGPALERGAIDLGGERALVSGGIVVGLTLIWWPLWIVALLPYGLMVRHFARRLVWSDGYQDGDAGAHGVPTTEAGQ